MLPFTPPTDTSARRVVADSTRHTETNSDKKKIEATKGCESSVSLKL